MINARIPFEVRICYQDGYVAAGSWDEVYCMMDAIEGEHMEEYGMPKFKDQYPAMDILQLVKDDGYRKSPAEPEKENPFDTNCLQNPEDVK